MIKRVMKSCKTCRKAEWEFTPKGNIRRNSYGKCGHDFGECPPIPPDPVVKWFSWPPTLGAIQPAFGQLCPCWELKE